MAEATFDFGFAGKQTVRVSLDPVSLDPTSEFLRFQVRVSGPRPIVQFQAQGNPTAIFTQDQMRFENGVLTMIFPPNFTTPFKHNLRYGLSVSFAGGTPRYDVLIEKMGAPPEGGPPEVLEIVRDTTLTSNDVKDWFLESFRILIGGTL